MPRLPMIPNESGTTICFPDSLFPPFYMEDFSVLGLRVGNLTTAVRVLEKNGIRINKGQGFNELSLREKDEIPHIIQLLTTNGISCAIADIVEHVYQG